MKRIDKNKPHYQGKKIKSSAKDRLSEGNYRKKPTFSLEHLPHGKRYCLSKCEKDEKAAFADTIHALSRMTWQEIITAPRHGKGSELISRDSLKCKLPQHVEDDPSIKIHSIRFCAEAPMLGYKSSDGTFYVIAFDRDFSAYKH